MNCVMLIGRLTKDPELRYTTSQTAVCSVTLAIDRPTKEKQTDFPRVIVFGKQAESLEKYVRKGNQIAVVGSIQTGSYEKNGEKVFTTDVVANRVEFLSRPEKAEGAEKPRTQKQESFGGFAELEESVPF